jgi:hypothetical protein
MSGSGAGRWTGLVFTAEDVLGRAERFGDLFAGLADTSAALPSNSTRSPK